MPRLVRKPRAATVKEWEARLTRMKCSMNRGECPSWLKYENEIGRLFLVADAEYVYPASKHRTGPKPHAD